MKLGLINSAWAQTGRDTAWGIRKTKELGFDTIDIFADPLDIDVRERKLIKREADQAGLPIVSICCVAVGLVDFNPSVQRFHIERVKQYLDFAYELEAKNVLLVLGEYIWQREVIPPAAQWQWAADSLATLGEEARGMGIRLALEIVNRYESNLVNTVAQGLALLAAIGSDNVFLHLDTFHLHIEETDPLQALRAALPRLAYLELDQNHRGRPDQGAIDFGPWLACAVAGGYRGPIGIEAFSASVIGPEIGGAIGIWRDLFQDGDEVARSGIAAIRHGLTQARLP